MPEQGKLSGLAIAEGIAGFLLFWSGLKNQSITDVIREGLGGKTAQLQATGSFTTQGPPVIGVTSGSAASGSAANSAAGTTLGPTVSGGSAQGSGIASDALRYKGAGYVWGGAPAKGVGNWDCSSFANWVIGHDEGLAIPGYAAGKYSGSSHGPTTLSYLTWTGATTIGHKGSVAQAGDLAVWQTHMGICLGPDQMISAQDPANGTQVSAIDGFIPGELLYIRRLK